jgi:hypothetical protein
MLAHHGLLGGLKRPLLEQDAVGDPDPAHVVQERPLAEAREESRVFEPQLVGEEQGIVTHPPRVASGVAFPELERTGEGCQGFPGGRS